jgi:F-type H+-transporting ATPase subunit delta
VARPSTAARRYAEALFDLARREHAEDRWAAELEAVAGLLGDERVRTSLDSPAIPFSEREAVLRTSLDGKVSPTVLNLTRLLAERSRLELIEPVAAQYRRLLNRQKGIVEAVVTSAQPLTPDESRSVRDRVTAMTGAQVDLREQVDASLIGGLTVQVGDRLLDASVRGRLERLRNQLIAGTRSR